MIRYVVIPDISQEVFNKLVHLFFDNERWQHCIPDRLRDYQHIHGNVCLSIYMPSNYCSNHYLTYTIQDYPPTNSIELPNKELKKYFVEHLLTGRQLYYYLTNYIQEHINATN